MAAVTVRNLPEETHRALKLRAARNGRSTEAEIRVILEEAVRPEGRIERGHTTQFSISSSETWRKARSLVTNTAASAKAWAAICISRGPSVMPFRSK